MITSIFRKLFQLTLCPGVLLGLVLLWGTVNPVLAQEPTATVQATTAVSGQSEAADVAILTSRDYWFLVLLGVAGMFGGLLFGMKDKKLKLPHRNRRSENIVEVGFLADILFGFAGGYVVFLILPAFTFEINLANVVKIVALSTVGGYGGRALVERVLTTQLQKLESSIQELQDQNSMDGKALALLTQQLDADPDKPSTSPEEIQKTLELASSRLKALAFTMARDFRKSQLNLGNLNSLDRAEPVFQALINLDSDHKYHRNLAQLGYLLKDKHPHDFRNAEKYLTQAIAVRDTQSEPGFMAYEFNRAICRIALKRPATEIVEDLNRAMGGETTRYWVQNPHPSLAEGLVEWLQTDEDGQKWAAANKITLLTPAAEPGPPPGE